VKEREKMYIRSGWLTKLLLSSVSSSSRSSIMEATLAALNNVVLTERVKFRDLRDGEYLVKSIESKICKHERSSWRSIHVTASNEEGKVFAFFLPSVYASTIKEEDISKLNQEKIGIRKEGVSLSWFNVE